MSHVQQAALAMHEANALQAFVTTFVWRKTSPAARALSNLDMAVASRLSRQLARRSITTIPDRLIKTHPQWELLRSVFSVALSNPLPADWAWDRMSQSFDGLVARRYVPRADVIQGFEYTALRSFVEAEQRGVAKILHLPSLDSRHFEEIQRREKELWPELIGPHDAYFDARFDQRYERRRQEIDLADVIITNSTLTARSHVAAGADAAKVLSVPLAAPPTIASDEIRINPHDEPLRVLWAGPFSLRKGAHYLLDAWRILNPGVKARLEIFGRQLLPERAHTSTMDGLYFHGSVPQAELFKAYREADVLVFPTLSDGFGMVVAEALAHGLPVITTKHAGATDLLDERTGMIVPAADPAALAEALQWCLDNRPRLAEMRYDAVAAASRRQWSHFRRDLLVAIDSGLRRAGYDPDWSVT